MSLTKAGMAVSCWDTNDFAALNIHQTNIIQIFLSRKNAIEQKM
jgi:hypothetical protein